MNARKTGGRDELGITGELEERGLGLRAEGLDLSELGEILSLKRSQRGRLLVAAVKINGASCERTDLQGSERGRLGSLRGFWDLDLTTSERRKSPHSNKYKIIKSSVHTRG